MKYSSTLNPIASHGFLPLITARNCACLRDSNYDIISSMKIIEFSGMPNAGKTTLISKLNGHLVKAGFTSEIISDHVRNSPIKPKGSFGYNLYGILHQFETLLLKQSLHNNFLLLDRGPHDVIVFSRVLKKYKFITDSESRNLIQIGETLSNMVTDYILFLVSPEKSLSRDATHNSDAAGIIMNPRFLRDLYSEYSKLDDKSNLRLNSDENTLESCFDMLKDYVQT